jgi:hypothetical protein
MGVGSGAGWSIVILDGLNISNGFSTEIQDDEAHEPHDDAATGRRGLRNWRLAVFSQSASLRSGNGDRISAS